MSAQNDEPQETKEGMSSSSSGARINLLVRHQPGIAHRIRSTRRYSQIVRSMRLGLPIVIFAIVVVLVIWTRDDAAIDTTTLTQSEAKNLTRNELVKPKFQALDDQNQPYSITADQAMQNQEDASKIMLTAPRAHITLNSGRAVNLTAQAGEYDQGSGQLRLNGAVKLTQDQGYELETPHADIDMARKTVVSHEMVTGSGPKGDISAHGLEANSTHGQIIFKGPAKLILRSAAGTEETGADAPSPTPPPILAPATQSPATQSPATPSPSNE